jgi:hypothetical protein
MRAASTARRIGSVPQERDVDRAEGPRGIGIAGQLGGQLDASRRAEEAAGDDCRAQARGTPIHRQRLKVVADDRSDHEMDGIRAEIDGRADDPLPGRRRLGRGQGSVTVRTGSRRDRSLRLPERRCGRGGSSLVVREPAGLAEVFLRDRLTAGLRVVLGADAGLPVAAGLAADAVL